ncbi:MAG: response regulator transcription factor [Clostridia bacterium]|jgi:two component transcriptional regulator, winged helix family|nr:two component transcriptional regulator winged helix family [Clostridium sp. CAG:452]
MKVLIVEDERTLSDTIKQCICKKFDTEQAYDGYEAYMMAKENIYDAIILDLMLPEMSGYDVLLKLRENKVLTPVLILTAKDTLNDKLKGFNYGADDYLVKPFEREELLARLEAIIRRTNGAYKQDEIEFKDLKLNIKSRRAFIKDKEITLQGKQFDILEYLINSKGTIITKEQIFDKIWGFDSFTTTNVVEVYASGLRKTLKQYGYDKYIKTIRGVGYMITD